MGELPLWYQEQMLQDLTSRMARIESTLLDLVSPGPLPPDSDVELASRLAAGDGTNYIRIPDTAVEEARRVDLELDAACVLLIMESSGGRNVFGNDATKCSDDQLGYFKGGEVTKASYEAYKANRDICGYQGVGPTQLTWISYQDQADELGGCWRPEVNCRVGFQTLTNLIDSNGGDIQAGFGQYNGGPRWRENTAALRYTQRALELLSTWRGIVNG